jgi:hypothetical protein
MSEDIYFAINQCLNPAECKSEHSHVRVGNEIHHCGGGDGCECGACMALFWGATCGDQRVREYLNCAKDAREYDASNLPNILDNL